MTATDDKTAAIVIIGNELLSGEVADLNAVWLARELGELGVEVRLILVLPDEEEVVADYLRELRGDYDLVLTSGGVGPTPDDITREAAARALGRRLVLHRGMAERLEEIFDAPLTESERSMAYLPEGSQLFSPPRPAFPGFWVENIYVFPGMPDHLHRLFPAVREHFRGRPRHVREILTRLREFDFVHLMVEVSQRFPALSLGSYPGLDEGGYFARLVIKGRDKARVEESASWLERQLEELTAKPKV